MQKHTRGPWVVHRTHIRVENPRLWAIGNEELPSLAFVNHWTDAAGEAEANAILIAAAPDLADALEGLIAAATAPEDSFNAATDHQAAVNRARAILRAAGRLS